MNIPWKLKSFIFSVIVFFDAHRILYFLQKYVTKRSTVGILYALPIWQTHKKYLKKYGATKTLFEFGAGKNLAQNLYLSDLVEKQIVVDLNPMIDLALVEIVRHQISKLVDLKSDIKIETLQKLGAYGIEYRAPYDAAKIDFNEKSIDACVSTNTLEHIPEESILPIFLRLYKTLKDNGIVSAKIDYSDHYAHTDKTISLLNYLKFDQNGWRKYNHNCHFQNRLRHYDYVKIFKRCGFVVIEEDLVFSESEIPTEIIQAFKDKDETWKATSAHIVLKKTS
jgi:hypothetical protein